MTCFLPLAQTAAPHVAPVDIGIIVLYFVALFGLGIYMSRRQKSEETYFLGGRQTSWFLAGVSVIASLLSTLTYLSTPGEMIGHGSGYFYSLLAQIAVVPAVTMIIIPALMRLKVTSVYDCLERRFGLAARMTGALVFLVTRLLWIGLIIYTASKAISAMTDWPAIYIMLLIGAATIFYTSIGGLEAVIWADVAQFALLFGGAAFIPIYIAFLTHSTPDTWWTAVHAAPGRQAPFFSTDLTVRITIVGIVVETFLWNFCTHGSDQIAAQRYLSTPSAASAKRSVWVFSLCSVFVATLLALCGMAIFHFNSSQGMPLAEIDKKADDLMPRFISTQLPVGVSGLMLAAILASAMSCLSSGINSISTVVVTDFVQRFKAVRHEKLELLLAKFLVVAAGCIGVVIAFLVKALMEAQPDWRLVDLIARVNHLFVAPLGALFLVGILSRRIGAQAALLGFFLGVVASVGVSFSGEFKDKFLGNHAGDICNVDIDKNTIKVRLESQNPDGSWTAKKVETNSDISIPPGAKLRHAPISFTWIMPFSFVVSLVSSYLLGFFFKPPTASQLVGLYAFGDKSEKEAVPV